MTAPRRLGRQIRVRTGLTTLDRKLTDAGSDFDPTPDSSPDYDRWAVAVPIRSDWFGWSTLLASGGRPVAIIHSAAQAGGWRIAPTIGLVAAAADRGGTTVVDHIFLVKATLGEIEDFFDEIDIDGARGGR